MAVDAAKAIRKFGIDRGILRYTSEDQMGQNE